MPLNKSEKLALIKQAHHLKPVVIIGNQGLTDPVQIEIDRALEAHELIKIRINAIDREQRQTFIDEICRYQKAEWIKTIGHVAIFWRNHV